MSTREAAAVAVVLLRAMVALLAFAAAAAAAAGDAERFLAAVSSAVALKKMKLARVHAERSGRP